MSTSRPEALETKTDNPHKQKQVSEDVCGRAAVVAFRGAASEYSPWIEKSAADRGVRLRVVAEDEDLAEVVTREEIDALLLVVRKGAKPEAGPVAEIPRNLPVVLFEPELDMREVAAFREEANARWHEHHVVAIGSTGLSHYQVGPVVADAIRHEAEVYRARPLEPPLAS